MEELKATIAELRSQLAELKAGDQTAENAAKILELRKQITEKDAELVVLAEAFEGGEGVDDAPVEEAPAEEAPAEAPAAPVEAPAETPAAPAEAPAAPAEEAGEEEAAPTGPVALAASASDVSPTASSDSDLKPMTLVASSGTAGIAAGSQLDRDQVMQILTASAQAGTKPTNGNVRMFGIERWGADADAPSDGKAAIENTRLIAAARARHMKGESTRPVALTAGGLFCGPDELIRETGVVGERGRPVAGLFPSIPISGGFRAMPDIAMNVDNAGSVVQWTMTAEGDQDGVDASDDSTWKPCTELDCFSENEYVPYAVVGCTTVRRPHRWAHPEQIDAWINLLGIEYDAVAETILLDILESDAGTPLTVGATGGEVENHGLLAKLIYALGSLSYSLGYQFREGSGVLERYTVVAPVGFAEALLADELLRGFPSGIKTKAELLSRVEQGFGVRLVERLDESTSRKTAAAATVTYLNGGGAIDDSNTQLLPPTFRLYVVRTDQWVHGEGTLVAADWHVDNALLRQNKMQYFLENVEILERLGVSKSHIIDVPGAIVGAYSDLVTPPDGTGS